MSVLQHEWGEIKFAQILLLAFLTYPCLDNMVVERGVSIVFLLSFLMMTTIIILNSRSDLHIYII